MNAPNQKQASNPAPRPVFAFHRERLGEWAVVVVLLLHGGLWLCWPRGVYRPATPMRQAEPGAAYVRVLLSGNPLMHHPDRFAHGGTVGARIAPAPSLLPPAPPPPMPPPPPYADVVVSPVERPTPRAYVRPAPISLEAAPPILDLPPRSRVPSPAPVISAALREATFQFEMPAMTTGVGRVVFRVALSPDGRVASLLDETPGNAGAPPVWRRALLSGRGTTNATGVVAVEW